MSKPQEEEQNWRVGSLSHPTCQSVLQQDKEPHIIPNLLINVCILEEKDTSDCRLK